MNIFSGIAQGLKAAEKVAKLAGQCNGCLIRRPGSGPPCGSCGTILCSNCIAKMAERNRDHNARVRRIPGTPVAETNVLLCEACSDVWGYL
jgi:hypothetical protein